MITHSILNCSCQARAYRILSLAVSTLAGGIGMAIEDFKHKLINQIGNGETITLDAVAFDFNLESLVPRRIARSSAIYCTLCITPHFYGVNSKLGSQGRGFSVTFLIQNLKGR